MKYLNTMVWFLKKPRYIPQIFQVLKRKKNAKKENTHKEATLWCEKNCITKNTALKLLQINNNLTHPKDVDTEIYQWAKKQEETCPVKMGGRRSY